MVNYQDKKFLVGWTEKEGIQLSSWGCFLLFIIPALKCYAIQLNSTLDLVFDGWGVLSFLLLLLLSIGNNDVKLPKGAIFFILFWCIYIVATIIHSGLTVLLSCISEISRIMIIPLYLYFLRAKGHTSYLFGLNKLRILFSILLVIDSLITLIEIVGVPVFSYGKICSLFGLDNYAIFFILPMLTINLYASQKKYGRVQWTDKIIFAFCFITKILTDTVTGYFALLLMVAMIILLSGIKGAKYHISLKVIYILLGCFILGIILFQVQLLFAPFFNLIGKDATMSYRTIIWNKTFAAILRNPIIGYGAIIDKDFQVIVGLSPIYDVQANHPHNYLLAQLFTTGILGFLIFFGMLSQAFTNIKRNIADKECIYLMAGMIGFMVLMFTDDYITIPSFYVLITICLLLPCKSVKKYEKN